MQPNPVLRKLGLADTDRVVIIHTDDIGMCQANVDAFANLWQSGNISSGAMMTPCGWFPAAAAFCRANPRVDMGIHATLNAEWDTYRWGPLSSRDPGSGLLDSEGFFHRSVGQVQAQADPAAVQLELETQIKTALAAGVKSTHIDTHMGTVMHPKFVAGYLQLAIQYRLTPMIMRMDEADWLAYGADAQTAVVGAQMVQMLEEQGVPLVDQICMMNLEVSEQRFEQTCEALAGLAAGVTHFIIHPAVDTPEIRAIAPDWRCRVADYNVFMDERIAAFVQQSGLQVIGYRTLQELMPK